MKFQRLTILASAVILGLGLSSGAYAFSAEMTKSYSQGDKASFLAGAHNQKGISCQTRRTHGIFCRPLSQDSLITADL